MGLLAGAAAVLLLLAGCVTVPDRADSGLHHLPLGVSRLGVQLCMSSAGLGSSEASTAVWRDSQGIHVRIGRGSSWTAAGGGVSNTESALLSCLNVAAGPDRYPNDPGSLLLLWKYSRSVLWPCLADHGVDAGAPPPRRAFLGGDPLLFDPFDRLASSRGAQEIAELRHECPPLPDYLAPAAH